MVLVVLVIYAAICWKQNKMVKQIKNIIENNFNILHNKYEVPQNAIQTHKCIGHPEIDSYGIMSPETFFLMNIESANGYCLKFMNLAYGFTIHAGTYTCLTPIFSTGKIPFLNKKHFFFLHFLAIFILGTIYAFKLCTLYKK